MDLITYTYRGDRITAEKAKQIYVASMNELGVDEWTSNIWANIGNSTACCQSIECDTHGSLVIRSLLAEFNDFMYEIGRNNKQTHRAQLRASYDSEQELFVISDHYIGWKKYYRNVDGKFVFVTAESFVDSLKEAEGTV